MFLGIEKSVAWGVTYTGQPLPISFRPPDGRDVYAALRNFTVGGPRIAEQLQMRYHRTILSARSGPHSAQRCSVSR